MYKLEKAEFYVILMGDLIKCIFSPVAGQSCPDSDEIQCGGGEDRCIPLRYICDGDTDCDNDDDEDDQLCEVREKNNPFVLYSYSNLIILFTFII